MGTDIRLQFTLDELSDYDATSIKQLRCYVIRKEDIQYIDLDNYGYPQYYSPTDYDLVYTRCHMYNWLPYNQEVYTSGMFGPIDDYRYFPAYNGFGVRSKQFKIVPDKYLAASRVISGSKQIEMYFPAENQKNFGQYIVLIVITVYQPGWGSNNLRTFTINKGVQFEIVDDYNSNDNSSKDDDIIYESGKEVQYDNFLFKSKKMLDLYKQTTPVGYHKITEVYYGDGLIGGLRVGQMLNVSIIKEGEVYNYINKPINGKKQTINISGNKSVDQQGNFRSQKYLDLYSFIADDDYQIRLVNYNNTEHGL